MTNNRHRRQFLLGFLGFLGFLGIRYFTTHELSDLFWFSWLAFFGYFPVAKVTRETPDERYWENAAKARECGLFHSSAGAVYHRVLRRIPLWHKGVYGDCQRLGLGGDAAGLLRRPLLLRDPLGGSRHA